jgi:hypothetical protein
MIEFLNGFKVAHFTGFPPPPQAENRQLPGPEGRFTATLKVGRPPPI